MRLGDLYRNIVEIGMRHDPRGKKGVESVLRRNRRQLASARGRAKAAFDRDSIFNPYNDTRILYGSLDREVRTVLAGVDVESAELLLADRLGQMGRPIDLVISHHPGGRALAELYKVMGLQTDQLIRLGVSCEAAQGMMDERMAEVARRLHSKNSMRNIDTARLLDLPYMCAHTAADNLVNSFLQRLIDSKRPKTIKALIDVLEGVHEFREGIKFGIGPMLLVGDEKKPAGRVFVDMTGGTEGSKRAFARLSQIGIGTLVCMHLSEDHFKEAKKERLNVIIAGHIPSDSIGLNIMFDALLRKDRLDIIPCSGFIRHSRR